MSRIGVLFVLYAAVALHALSSPPVSRAQLVSRIEAILMTGDALPGGGPGTYDAVQPPVLNDRGEAAIRARLRDTGAPGDSGLFRGGVRGVTQIARFGDVLPGETEPVMGFRTALINNQGQIVSEGGTNGPQDNRIYLFDDEAGAQIVARLGDPPPVGGGAYVDFGAPYLNQAGQVAFSVSFVRFGNPNQGVYVGDADGLTEVRRGGINRSPALADSGAIVFSALVNGETLFYYDGHELSEVVRSGDMVPGGAATFGGTFPMASVNSAGQFAISPRIIPEGGGTTAGALFFYDTDAGFIDALPLGSPAPDGNGALSDIGRPTLNDAGQMAFSASLQETLIGAGDDRGAYILSGPGGELTQIAREFERPPNQDGVFHTFTGVAINNLGHAAFEATLRATSAGSVNALYFYAPQAGLLEILREGDPLLGSTVVDFGFVAGPFDTFDGVPGNVGNGFNNHDQIAFSVRLADGRQGVAITSVVPEPAALVVLLVAAGVASTIRLRNTRP